MRHSCERRANVAMYSQLLRRIAIRSLFSRATFVRHSCECRTNVGRIVCELAITLRLVCEFWAANSQISCEPVAIKKNCESGSKKSVKIRIFFRNYSCQQSGERYSGTAGAARCHLRYLSCQPKRSSSQRAHDLLPLNAMWCNENLRSLFSSRPSITVTKIAIRMKKRKNIPLIKS